MLGKLTISVLIIFLIACNCFSQTPPINFHHLTVKDGLNDGSVNAICQDKYGYMWFASLGALNRYSSTEIKKYTHKYGDSNSLKNAVPYSMAAGKDERIWIGYADGLLEFNIASGIASPVHAIDGYTVASLIVTDDNKLYVGTYNGLIYYNPALGHTEPIIVRGDSTSSKLLFRKPIYGMTRQKNRLYMGTDNGVVTYDINEKKASFIPLPQVGGSVNKVVADKVGRIWVTNYKNYRLLLVSPDGKNCWTMDHLLMESNDKRLSQAVDLRIDNKDRVWIISSHKGLLQYDPYTNKTIFHQHSNLFPASISENELRTMHLNDDGTLWVSGTGSVDFFHPDKNLFSVMLPFNGENEPRFARGVIEDQAGNFWFTTGDGISRYDPITASYKVWKNEAGKEKLIYYNSVRGVAEDNEHRIWFATGQGVNRLNTRTGKMEFLSAKDSLPEAFYFSANKLEDGTIWFGTRDYDGFYFYSPTDKKNHSIATIPAMKEFAGLGGRYVFQDSKKRLWFGFNGAGVGMYDPMSNKTRRWVSDDTNSRSRVVGNLVVDIKEDRKGIVWISFFGGLTGIDVENEQYYHFTNQNGLRSTIACPLAVDALNRLWIGSSAGLALLDSNRKYFTYFGTENGLPAIDFPEHPGIYARNGDIIFPSRGGYIRFDPLQFQETRAAIPCYISSFNLIDQNRPISTTQLTGGAIRLRADENFFSINLTGLNYENPSQTWYAYWLEGFDQNWRFTQDPKAVYTKVPGGKYTFHYKATANTNNWKVPEKTLDIRINTAFYKSLWFWSVMSLLVLTPLFWFYRNRLIHRRQVLSLRGKAQLLEKEKAMVMYENLKQHLNPHFLFNSLTSLSSLIRLDQGMAADFLDKMSKVYRYILKNRDKETVTLGEELKFVHMYVQLQKTRFENGLLVEIKVDEDYYHKKIVPVSLQNLVENAIKHNSADESQPLIIRLFIEDDYLVVQNNLQRKGFVETSNKQGLSNMVSLYSYLSDRPMIVGEKNGSFIVKIPLL